MNKFKSDAYCMNDSPRFFQNLIPSGVSVNVPSLIPRAEQIATMLSILATTSGSHICPGLPMLCDKSYGPINKLVSSVTTSSISFMLATARWPSI